MLSEHNKFLETAYTILNEVYFEDKLPEVVITIQSSQKAYGHITTGKIWKNATESYYEINISAEYLNRPVENIIATLVHEMCHLYAVENSIQDTSNNNRYHNKKFKEIATKRDLKISYAPTIGWSVTEPTEGLINTIKKYGLDKQIEFVRMVWVLISLQVVEIMVLEVVQTEQTVLKVSHLKRNQVQESTSVLAVIIL